MHELVFIGLGLHNELGISLRGQAAAQGCDHVLAEFYTNKLPGLKIENLKRIVGKPVEILSRADVEDHAESRILSRAKSGRVAFLVPGDPMVATTHIDLRLRAHKAGIVTRIIHAASVESAAAGAAGLQSYKFGRTVSIPITTENRLPESVHQALEANFKANLHSLVLLEIDVENQRHVTIPQALEQLISGAELRPNNVVKPETLVVGIARLEAPDMIVLAGTVSDLKRTEFGEPPYCLIFPAALHFVEAEALQVLCGAAENLVAREA